jgi:chitin disaccharide deacetylase
VGCHPGYVDADLRSSYRREREIELETLLDPRVREAAAALDIRFASFADLFVATERGAA